MKFTYSSGQRPLDGYSLKRGIGQGGFGEVYFAVSDGGKEVALKLLRGNSEIELRGVAQCLNLKHPNLVNLYDLKTDAEGNRWVVMEYIAGEPLSAVLNRHPNGLPPELALPWFLALARAVGYLHDHGIVHRDLKPGNIFLENGSVKVGDYGLSKSISGSQRMAQTQSVGTVHYMAPEISTGNYNKQIDVYAAGIILYEMLTGRVPFDGESPGEILMKHLTATPDLSRVPPDYLPIVARALSKDPSQRFVSMTEMAREVEKAGAEVEEVQAVPLARPRSVSPPRAIPVSPAKPPPQPPPTVLPVEVSLRSQIGELSGSMALAALLALLGTILWAAVGPNTKQLQVLNDLGTIFFLTVAASWTVLVPAKFWSQRRGRSGSRRVVMLVLGLLLGLVSLWLQGWSPHGWPVGFVTINDVSGTSKNFTSWFLPTGKELAEGASYVIYFALIFFVLRWWRMADPCRGQRFSFLPVLAAAFWALVPLALWPEASLGAVALVMTSAIVQLVSPWLPPAAPPSHRRMRLRYTGN
jgi:serine/threonine protein kinase